MLQLVPTGSTIRVRKVQNPGILIRDRPFLFAALGGTLEQVTPLLSVRLAIGQGTVRSGGGGRTGEPGRAAGTSRTIGPL